MSLPNTFTTSKNAPSSASGAAVNPLQFTRPTDVVVVMMETDVSHGRPGKCLYCPICLAVNRATGLYSLVTGTAILLYQTGLDAHRAMNPIATAELPQIARTFIQQFDGPYCAGMIAAPEPITFTAEFTPKESSQCRQ